MAVYPDRPMLGQVVRIARREAPIDAEPLERGTGEVRERKLIAIEFDDMAALKLLGRDMEDAVDCDFVVEHGLGKGNAQCQTEIASAEPSLSIVEAVRLALPEVGLSFIV